MDNQVVQYYGADIFAGQTRGLLTLKDCTFSSPNARTSIYIDTAGLHATNIKVSDIEGIYLAGAAINAYDPSEFTIADSIFSNLRDIQGGAIHINQRESAKLDVSFTVKSIIIYLNFVVF